MKDLFLALRPKQWVKNLFVLLPLLFGQKLFTFPENLHTLIATFLFSLAASSAYLVNDLWDRDYDKSHEVKRFRPIASGKIDKRFAVGMALLLGALSLAFSFKLNLYLGSILAVYLLINFIYTIFLKHVVILDVFSLAFFYLLRIMAGTFVAKVEFSHWMILMTVLLAMFLGFHKRRHEIETARGHSVTTRTVLSKYTSYFIDQMTSVLTASIVIFYLLYTLDERTVGLVGSNHLILSAPFVYYGIFRYLYLVHKEFKGDDPTVILFSDRMMQVNLALWLVVCSLVIYLKI